MDKSTNSDCTEPGGSSLEWNIDLAVLNNALESEKGVHNWYMGILAWWCYRHKYMLFLNCNGTFCCNYNSGRLAVGKYTELLATRAQNKLLKYYKSI